MIVNLLWQFSLFEDVDANSFQFLVKKSTISLKIGEQIGEKWR